MFIPSRLRPNHIAAIALIAMSGTAFGQTTAPAVGQPRAVNEAPATPQPAPDSTALTPAAPAPVATPTAEAPATTEAPAGQPITGQSTTQATQVGDCGDASGVAEAATTPQPGADGTAPGNAGTTGFTGGLGGSQIGTNTQGAVTESKTWQPPTARGLDLAGVPETATATATDC